MIYRLRFAFGFVGAFLIGCSSSGTGKTTTPSDGGTTDGGTTDGGTTDGGSDPGVAASCTTFCDAQSRATGCPNLAADVSSCRSFCADTAMFRGNCSTAARVYFDCGSKAQWQCLDGGAGPALGGACMSEITAYSSMCFPH